MLSLSQRIETAQPPKPFKRRLTPPSDLLHSTNTKARLERTETLIPKRNKVYTLRQNRRKGYQQARPVHKDLPSFLFTSVSSHHIPLLSCHNPSMVREGIPCSDSRNLGSITPLTKPHAFPGTACPGPCGNSMPLLQAPNPSRRERPCHQARTTRRRAALRCTHCLLESHLKTRFRLQTKLRPHFPILESLDNTISIRFPDQEHDIHFLRLILLPR